MERLRIVLGTLAAALAMLLLSSAAALAQAAAAPMSGTATPRLALDKVFTYFLVMLGPFKLLGPFVRVTAGMDDAACHRLAVRAAGIATLGGVAAAYVGQTLLRKWEVSIPALLLAAGLVLLVVALQAVLAQYTPPPSPSGETGPGPEGQKTSLTSSAGLAGTMAFPNIVTPYGTAALILLMAASDYSGGLAILGLFLAVMALNLLAMWFARPIVRVGAAYLAVLSAVLGVLQVALAIQLLLVAGRLLGVLRSSGG